MREVPSSLIEEWMAYYRVEPFGDDWLQAATVASVASASGFKKVIPVSELIPKLRLPQGMTDDQITAVLDSIRMAFC